MVVQSYFLSSTCFVHFWSLQVLCIRSHKVEPSSRIRVAVFLLPFKNLINSVDLRAYFELSYRDDPAYTRQLIPAADPYH